MHYLLDTNILLRWLTKEHPHHAVAVGAIARLLAQNETLYTAPQIYYEFWNVATRPLKNNGLGLTPDQAQIEMEGMLKRFPLLPDTSNLFTTWQSLVIRYQVSGAKVHDTRLVATMINHSIPYLLTFNHSDFHRFEEITPVDPLSL